MPNQAADEQILSQFAEQNKEALGEEMYGSVGQQVGTALEGAGEAVTLGLSPLIERGLGISRGKDILARREVNPISHIAGQIGGLAASSMYAPGGGAAGLMEGAGAGAAEALGGGLLGTTVKGAVEGGIMGMSDEVAKMMSSDPSQGAESAISNVGLSALGGGLISGGLKAAHPLWEATAGKKISGILGAVKDRMAGLGAVSDDVSRAISASGMEINPELKAAMGKDPFVRQMFQKLNDSATQGGVEAQESLKKLMIDAKEHLANTFGFSAADAEKLTGSLSSNKFGDAARKSLTDELKLTAEGGLNAEQAHENFKKLAPEAAANALGRTSEDVAKLSELSASKKGQQAATVLEGELREKFGDSIKTFQDVKKNASTAPLSATDRVNLKDQITGVMSDMRLNEAVGSAEHSMAKNLLDNVDNFKDIRSIMEAQSRLNLPWSASPSEMHAARNLKAALRDIEGNLVEQHFTWSNPQMGEEGVNFIKGARQEYAKAMDLIERVNENVRAGKVRGPESFFKDLKDLSPEDLLKRLSDKNDAKLLETLKGELPNTAELVRQAHVDDLLKRAKVDGKLDVEKLHDLVDSLSPEMKQFTLREGAQSTLSGIKEQMIKGPSIAVEDSMAKLNRLNKVLKLGKIGSPSEFFEKLSDSAVITNENLMKKLSDAARGDAEVLTMLHRDSPETFSALVGYERAKILEGAVNAAGAEGERLGIHKVFRNVENMPKEWRDMILTPEMEAKLSGIKTVLAAIPEKIGKSGTAQSAAGILSNLPGTAAGLITGVVSHNPILGVVVSQLTKLLGVDAPDAARLALLKFIGSNGEVSAPGFKAAVDFIKNAKQGQTLMGKSVKALVEGASDVLPTKLFPERKTLDRLDKVIERLQHDPEPLLKREDMTAHYLPEHDGAHSMAMSNAFAYLAQLRPKDDEKLPFDGMRERTSIEKAKYERALEIAEQPLVVIHSINNGTITKEDVAHLQAMYPSTYNGLRGKILDQISSQKDFNISYHKKFALSVFMGEPLESSLRQPSIAAAQLSLAGVQAQQQQKQQNMQTQALKGGGKSLTDIVSQSQTPQQARQAHKLGMA